MNTSVGALAVRGDQNDWTEEQKAALAQIGVAEAPHGDQLVFLHVSQRMGLDPFNKEIYMIGRWDKDLGRKKWTIQVGIDGFRSKSEEHPGYAGVDDVEWCGEDGQWCDVWLANKPPAAARFTVYRKDWMKPVRAVAHYREFVQLKQDRTPTMMWASKPAGQLAKCAEALARRRAFPRALGGVFIPEELEHLDGSSPGMIVEPMKEIAAEPEWDILITEAEDAGSLEKLGEVRALAQGIRRDDFALLERIAMAAERVRNRPTVIEVSAEPDWDAEIAEGVTTNDRMRLLDLLGEAKKLRPGDRALAARITQAGKSLKAVTEPAPAATGNGEGDQVPQDGAMPMSEGQEKKLFAIFAQGGIKDADGNRAARLEISKRVLQRPVTTWTTLTWDEASVLIDTLEPKVNAGKSLSQEFPDLPPAVKP